MSSNNKNNKSSKSRSKSRSKSPKSPNKTRKNSLIQIIPNNIEYVNEIHYEIYTKYREFIYKINIKDCDYYFKTSSELSDPVVFKVKSTFYIVGKDTDKIIEIINEQYINAPYVQHKIRKKLNAINILYRELECHNEKYEEAQKKIKELNRDLKGLQLHLDYLYNYKGDITLYSKKSNNINDLILCLYKDNKCVSSIEIILDYKYISINTRTCEECQGKKYNKLLRAVVIIIAKLLNPKNKYIRSEAINPISAYLSLHHFNGILPIDENERFFKYYDSMSNSQSNSKPKITLKMLKEYEDSEDFELLLHDPLTDKDILNAENKFKDTIEEIKP